MLRWKTGGVLLLITCTAAAQTYRSYRYPSSASSSRAQAERRSTQTRTDHNTAAARTPKTASAGSTKSATPTPSAEKTRTGPYPIQVPSSVASPGSFTLRNNLTASSDLSTAVIVITSSDIILNLGGFAIQNQQSASPDCCGIAVSGDRVTVRNGSISGFNRENQCGISVSSGVTGFRLEDLQIGDCETGILLNPDNVNTAPVRCGSISRCTLTGGAVGVLAFSCLDLVLDRCQVAGMSSQHGYDGEGSGLLLKGSFIQVSNCTLTGNQCGLRVDGNNCTVSSTVGGSNRDAGAIINGNQCVVRNCSFCGNGAAGLNVAGKNVVVSDCVCDGNKSDGCTLDKVQGISSKNTVLTGCTFHSNGGHGVSDRGAGGTVVENSRFSANESGALNLKVSDMYRNNVFICEAPRGGIDAGGNHQTDTATSGTDTARSQTPAAGPQKR